MVRATCLVALGQVLVLLLDRTCPATSVLVVSSNASVYLPLSFALALQIPGYGGYIIYQKVLLPYLFRGQSPFASLQNLARGGGGGAQAGAPGAQQPGQEALSKRQQKLQARAAKGDPRVQVRKR